MDEQDFLKEFGKKYVEDGYIDPLKYAKAQVHNPRVDVKAFESFIHDFSTLMDKATDKEKEAVVGMVEDVLEGALFNILRIFDWNEKFKLKYELDGVEYDLQKIAEDHDYGNGFLFGEIFNWIDWYAKESEE